MSLERQENRLTLPSWDWIWRLKAFNLVWFSGFVHCNTAEVVDTFFVRKNLQRNSCSFVIPFRKKEYPREEALSWHIQRLVACWLINLFPEERKKEKSPCLSTSGHGSQLDSIGAPGTQPSHLVLLNNSIFFCTFVLLHSCRFLHISFPLISIDLQCPCTTNSSNPTERVPPLKDCWAPSLCRHPFSISPTPSRISSSWQNHWRDYRGRSSYKLELFTSANSVIPITLIPWFLVASPDCWLQGEIGTWRWGRGWANTL